MRAACISAVRFASLAAQSAALRRMIVHCNDMLLAQLHQAAACNTVHHLQARLCRWLLHARDRLETDTIDVTQQFAACDGVKRVA